MTSMSSSGQSGGGHWDAMEVPGSSGNENAWHVDTHADSPHLDVGNLVIHTDSHTDTPPQPNQHVDTLWHTDWSEDWHLDSGPPHGDTVFQAFHGDESSTHLDSNTMARFAIFHQDDYGHVDFAAHNDVLNIPHEDTVLGPPIPSHLDSPHQDSVHTYSHGDVPQGTPAKQTITLVGELPTWLSNPPGTFVISPGIGQQHLDSPHVDFIGHGDAHGDSVYVPHADAAASVPPLLLHWLDQGVPAGIGITNSIGVITVRDTPTSSEQLRAYVQGSDGHLWLSSYAGGAWHWSDQGAPTGATVAGPVGIITVMDAPTAAQRPYAFVVGSDQHLWLNWWDGATWHWSDQGTPGSVKVADPVGAISVMDPPGERPYAFVVGSDQHLWVNWWDGATWHWSDQGVPDGTTVGVPVGAITVMDTPTAPTRPCAFVLSSTHQLWLNFWDGSTWRWTAHGTPPGVALMTAVGAITVMDTPSSSQCPHIFVVGDDGHLWDNWWNGNTWLWSDQGSPSGSPVVGRVGVITVMDNANAAQHPYVFVQGNGGHLWINWWDGLTWHWFDAGTPTGSLVGGAVGAVSVLDSPTAAQRPCACVLSYDNHLWLAVSTPTSLAGARVQASGDPALYLVDSDGTRRHIPDPTTYNNLFRDWNGVLPVSIGTLAVGADLTSGAYLATPPQGGPIYLVTNGQKRWISSPAVMDKFSFAWSQVRPVVQSTLDALPDGPQLT